MELKVIKGDITKIQCFDPLVDCIVNSANESLLGGSGVDGAIHRASGPELEKECIALGGCKPGEAKATKGYNLPVKYIIHAVGPRFYTDKNPSETLAKAYLSALELADGLGCERIAFPSISTGVFGFPLGDAARICTETVSAYRPKSLKIAYMCAFDERTFEAYKASFEKAEG